jgi:hypothetical protein
MSPSPVIVRELSLLCDADFAHCGKEPGKDLVSSR